MTAPAPKPIEDCPNPECKHFCAMYEAPFVSNDGLMHKVKCDDCGYMGPWARTSDEAIRLHNLLCRPQQSAEPVAWYDLPMANIELADAIVQEWQKRVESGAPAMPWGTGELVELISKLRPAASPGPSELVEEMEKLEAHIREVVRLTHIGGRAFGTTTALEWADDIARMIKHE